MFINRADSPSNAFLVSMMKKVNAYGHAPRVIVELDKFSYVPGLKRKYDVIEYVNKETTRNIVSIVNPVDGGVFHQNSPVMPLEGKATLEDMVITSKHRTVNPRRPRHKGLDIDLDKGDPVVTVWDGTVTEVKYDAGGYGFYVTVDHGNGVRTRYAHLDATLVNVGQTVKAGQRVGLGGNTGGVVASGGGDGSHLHFEVWKDGVDLNPENILNGSVTINGVSASVGLQHGTGSVTTITNTRERVTYTKDFNTQMPDGKFSFMQGEYFVSSTPQGSKKMFGFSTLQPSSQKAFRFNHQWFNDGYLEFSYFYHKGSPGDVVQVKMDGNVVWTMDGNSVAGGIGYPAPITVPRGNHTFEFTFRNVTGGATQSKFGLMSIKAGEFEEVHSQVVIPSSSGSGTGYTSSAWDYEDDMSDPSKWTPYNNDTVIINAGDYLHFTDSSSDPSKAAGMERIGVVSFPFTVQARVKVSPDTTGANIYVSDGQRIFTPKIKTSSIEGGGKEYTVDNTQWQEYMLVCKDSETMVIFHKRDGEWVDTGIEEKSEDYGTNRLMFYVSGQDTGTFYVDDVKYAAKDFSQSAPITVREMTRTPKWYEVGGFVYEDTFTLDTDIIEWEVSAHMDMASSTARVTLSNHHGLYSPEYVRSSVFPENLRENPYTYYENGEVRHVISEYTPVRIYAGYGDQVVRVFTGMIKGEIEENSEERTITFNCVDRYDLIEECVLLRDLSFPPEDSFNGDSVPRPWIKSSIVQYLANHAGMTGWRYVHEDLMHPDLVIEETYYTDVRRSNDTFMKFNSKGVLEQVTLDVQTPNGYRNPFVEAVIFKQGERVSDCIRRVVDEINFRTYCNRYGTFVMHRIDLENNMRWEFRSGDNLYSLNSSTDYSRVRNHLIITGSHGNQDHFFDKDLMIATKGHVRTAQIECPWIDESEGSAVGAKQEVADRLFFDMKRQSRTKEVVVKGNPFIEILDGCYVYDENTSTVGYYLIKGNTLTGNQQGMINRLELTWEEKVI